MWVPILIYSDFECFTENISTCQPYDKKNFTEQYQKHESSGFCYLIIKYCNDKLYKPKIYIDTQQNRRIKILVKNFNSVEKSVKNLYL